jgi:hypothetical protein
MKLVPLVAVALCSLLALNQALAAEPAANIPTEGKSNTICPIDGKPVNPAITMEYEGLTWSFADSDCRSKFTIARENSLYPGLFIDRRQRAATCVVDVPNHNDTRFCPNRRRPPPYPHAGARMSLGQELGRNNAGLGLNELDRAATDS